LGGSEKKHPWRVPRAWLGWRFAADVLLHEALHLSVVHRRGGWDGKEQTSHNNPAWVAEVNRLLGLLAIPGTASYRAGVSQVRRVPTAGPATVRGKRPTRVRRVNEGNLPFKVVAGFPGALRQHLRQANAYYQGRGTAPLPAFDGPGEPGADARPRAR
jgi:hypothetical protein